MAISILTVCSGNICRSPLAEQLLRQGLAGVADATVTSAGTIAMVGSPMAPQSQVLAARYGATDAAAHVARQLTAEQIVEADLVLALSRDHRRAIVEMVPSAVRKTFTLREFARLVTEVSDEDLADGFVPGSKPFASAIAVASSFRGIVAPADSPADDDVVDPYRQSNAVYQASADQLVPAVRDTVAFIERAASVS
ncbi:low molecular weight phosphatase family protein [Leifsonia sp. YIM 134122]|uniref:Low molecular weight phosphatase family protein n=1 Tax=Leifsonia stereocauli TaxID=3134136 RepID=A0ABU9W6I7_9MICO